MDKYRSEMYGEFTYPQNFTYDNLINCENILIRNLDEIFQNSGAEHIDFTPLGDLLKTQCAFEMQKLELFSDIAQEIAYILPDGIKGRLFCLRKSLRSYYLIWIERGKWEEMEYLLPNVAPESAKRNRIIPLST